MELCLNRGFTNYYKEFNNTERNGLSYKKSGVIERNGMCQFNPPKNVETNDNMRLENYILHFEIARTSFDVNVIQKR